MRYSQYLLTAAPYDAMADEETLCMLRICNYCFLYEMKNGAIEINAKATFSTYFSRAYYADDEIITYLSGR